jgi:acetoacetate decarboxylase
MLYGLTQDELAKLQASHVLPTFPNAEILFAAFRTDPAVVAEIVPRPLKPTSDPLASVFVARYPETNFGVTYNEGALFVHVQYRGEQGVYCLSMPVDDDMAMIGGREYYGYPKKIAESITLESTGDLVTGSVVRKGTEILRIECELAGEGGEALLEEFAEPVVDWDGVDCYKMVVLQFKFFPGPGGNFDYLPRLIREPVLFRPKGAIRQGSGRVILRSTPADPLAEIPVGEVVSMFHGRWHNTMLPGRVAGRVWNPMRFARHAFFKADTPAYLLETHDPAKVARAKEIYRAAKRF